MEWALLRVWIKELLEMGLMELYKREYA